MKQLLSLLSHAFSIYAMLSQKRDLVISGCNYYALEKGESREADEEFFRILVYK